MLKEYFKNFERFPVVPILGYPALPSLKISTQECLLDPEKHFNVAKYIFQEYKIDSILTLLDLTVEAEALGARVKYAEYEAPQIIEHVQEPCYRETEKMKAYVKTVRMLKVFSNDVPVGAYITGPYTAAGQTIGIEKLVLLSHRQEEKAKVVLEKVTETVKDYAKKLEEVGVDYIIIAEPTSSLLSKENFKKHSKPYLKNLTKELKTETILHICGKSKHLLEEVPDTGVAGISVDQNIPLYEAATILKKDFLIFGNYPPANLANEHPKTIKENVEKMLNQVQDKENIVASTGCDIPAKTPPENIKTFIQAVKSIKKKNYVA
ncbi:MAG: uroporphyrinogen decarboxylase family protein [Nitrososphaeria archaeon]